MKNSSTNIKSTYSKKCVQDENNLKVDLCELLEIFALKKSVCQKLNMAVMSFVCWTIDILNNIIIYNKV